jgi:hypothetical protein
MLFRAVYAQVDLKNMIVRIKDGYAGISAAFLVNNASGYMAGATTMTVDGGVGLVVVGDVFKVAGETNTPNHTVTAQTPTMGNTTSITFTPALASSVADDAAITFQPHSIDVKIGDGNFTYDEKRNVKYVKNRGRLDTVRLEDEEPTEVRMDATWEYITASTSLTPTIEDALKKRGEAAAWVTTSSDACEPYAVDIEVVHDVTCGSIQDEKIVLSDFRWESISHDAKQGTFSITGKCNVTQATVTRGTYS